MQLKYWLFFVLNFQDIPDGEVEAALKTAELEPPRILVIKRGGAIIGIFISGDGVNIRCHTSTDKTVTSAIITLLGVYYVFHLEYPKMYSQLLGILQTHLLRGIPFDGKKSAALYWAKSCLSNMLCLCWIIQSDLLNLHPNVMTVALLQEDFI